MLDDAGRSRRADASYDLPELFPLRTGPGDEAFAKKGLKVCRCVYRSDPELAERVQCVRVCGELGMNDLHLLAGVVVAREEDLLRVWVRKSSVTGEHDARPVHLDPGREPLPDRSRGDDDGGLRCGSGWARNQCLKPLGPVDDVAARGFDQPLGARSPLTAFH